MNVDKKMMAMIMAMSIGTGSVFAQPSNGDVTDDDSHTATVANTQTGVVIKNVYLRTQPNKTTSKIIRTLKVGEKVSIVGKSGNFYKIEYKSGNFGYAYGNGYITVEENKPAADSTTNKIDNNVGVSTANVNVRTSPNANIATNKIGKLLKGTKVEIVSQSGDFYKIKYQGQYAYASRYYISVNKGLKLNKIDEIKLTKGVVVRDLASDSSKELSTLQSGTTVVVVEKLSNNWYKIEVDDGYGYVKIVNKTDEKPDNNDDEKIENNVGQSTANVYVRTSPSTSVSTNIIGKLLKGTKVEIVGQSGAFYKVKYKGQYAYSSKYYISINKGLKLDKIDEIKLAKDVIVRDLASDSSKELSTLQSGTTVVVVEKLSNNWYKIEVDDSYGYVKIDNKTDEKPDDKDDEKIENNVGQSTANVYVRTTPDISVTTNIIGKLLKGTKVEIVGQSGNFYKIKYQGQYAYSSKPYISATKGLKLDKIDEIKLTKDVVVRELASDSSKELSTLQKDTTVVIVEKLENDWYKIELNDGYGYVKIDKYTDEKPDDKPEVKKNIIGKSTANVNIRTTPDTSVSTNILGVLKTGTKIEIVGEDGNFYKVKYKGQYAYVSKLYLSPDENLKLDKISELKLSEDVSVKELASDSSDEIMTLKQGTTVTVVEKLSNNWYKIYVDNTYGYINVKDAIKSKVGLATVDVNIRAQANTYSTIVGVLLKESKIEIAGESGDFYKVKYKGVYRYIYKKYLAFDENEKLNKVGELEVINEAKVRELASENSSILFILKEGTTVDVIERLFNGWYKIQVNNVYGYIKPTDGKIINSDKDINLIKENDHYYYIKQDGSKFKGYKVVDGVSYYFSNETGKSISQFVSVTEEENGKSVINRYYVKENGGVETNTFKKFPDMNNRTYYFGADGKAVRGINTINGKKYYFNTRYSYIMNGLCSVNEDIYYFDKTSFAMETNTSKTVTSKLKLSIGSDGKVYKMTKLDNSDLANMLYSGFSKMGTVYSNNYEEGLDCSNYVSEILREIGLNTFSKDERTSQQQAIYCEQNNLTVNKNYIKPGDILFYNNTNCSNIKKYGYCSRALKNGMHVHHVAIYIGDGKVMESTSSVNTDYEHAGVRIYNLSQSSTYYVYSVARVL